MNSRVAELEQRFNALQAEMEQTRKDLESARFGTQLDEIENTLGQARTQLDAVHSLSADLKALQDRMDALQKETPHLKKRIDELDGELRSRIAESQKVPDSVALSSKVRSSRAAFQSARARLAENEKQIGEIQVQLAQLGGTGTASKPRKSAQK